MKRQIAFARAEDRDAINELRRQEYARAQGFVVEASTLDWNQTDSESFVMTAHEGEQLVSTMRGEVIADLALLEKKLECAWNFPLSLPLPVLLLSRAATLSTHRARGLNLVLRYWFLRFAIAHRLPFVVGTFVQGSPRENSLREMGYQFFKNELGWQQSTYRSERAVQVVALNLEAEAERAQRYCVERLPWQLAAYGFEGVFPPLRTVSRL